MRVPILRGLMIAMLTLIAQGNATAQDFLSYGIGYANGQGAAKDDYKAVKWFRLAAEQGNALGQAYLGMMYANGRGVQQDYVLSYMWLTLGQAHPPDVAAKMNLAQINANIASIAAKMTAAQIDLAKKMANRCAELNYKQCSEPEALNAVLECREWVDGKYRGLYVFSLERDTNTLTVKYNSEGENLLFGRKVNDWRTLFAKDGNVVFLWN